MAARRDLLEAIIRALGTKRPKALFAGELTEKAFQDLIAINPSYTSPRTTISSHGLESRMKKDGWTPEQTANAYAEILSSKKTAGIPNFGGNSRSASEALWLPKDNKTLFAPTVPLENGEAKLLTLYDPEIEKVLSHLKKVGRSSGVRHPSISGSHRAISAGEPSSQPQRLSAVGNQPTLDDILNDIFAKVKNSKKAVPWLVGGAAAAGAMGTPAPAKASYAPNHAPNHAPDAIAKPTIDPIDAIIAAMTAPVSLPMRAVAGAADMGASYGFNKLMNTFSGGYKQFINLPQHMRGGAF